MVINFTNAHVAGYFLHTEIGRGGMGRVYQATHPDSEQEFAVKIVNHQTTEILNFERRFAREIKALNRLRHPAILPLLDSGQEEDGTMFMVMPLVENGTLRDYLIENDILTPAQAGVLTRQIGAALDYAHSQGIIHRDVKPHNIMMMDDGSFSLADFGIAAIANAEVTGGQLTGTGEMFGTIAYMSPEQITGDRVDGRADLYSLGIVLYQSLVGRLPFTGENTGVLLSQQLYALPLSPQLMNPEFPPEVELVLDKALAKKPEDRYQSGAEMAEALIKAFDMLPAESMDFPLMTDEGMRTARLTNVMLDPPLGGMEIEQKRPPSRRIPLLAVAILAISIIACMVMAVPAGIHLATAKSTTGSNGTATESALKAKDQAGPVVVEVMRSKASPGLTATATDNGISPAEPVSSGWPGGR